MAGSTGRRGAPPRRPGPTRTRASQMSLKSTRAGAEAELKLHGRSLQCSLLSADRRNPARVGETQIVRGIGRVPRKHERQVEGARERGVLSRLTVAYGRLADDGAVRQGPVDPEG